MRFITFIWINIFFLSCQAQSLLAQVFPCDGSIYYVGTNSVVGSKLYRLSIDSVSRQFKAAELPLNNPENRHITALGYNIRDQRLYGMDFNTNELLQIDSDGNLRVLDKKEIDPNYKFHGGGMSANGRRLLMIGRNKETGQDDRLYSIRINDPGYPLGFFPLNADRSVTMTDFAINPLTGVGYSFDEGRRQIVEMTDSGDAFTNLGHKEVNQVFGALFFDQRGNLYGLGNAGGGGAEQTTIYAINKGSGITERLTQVPGGRDTDACACPYTLDFKKSVFPRTVDGCGEITIEYTSVNHGGIGQVGVLLRDTLPQGFTITQVELPPEDVFIRKISGEGTNVLALEDWNLLIGNNRIRIRVQLNRHFSGPASSQASISNLFAAYGYQIMSDDPATPESDDATAVEILDASHYEIEDYVQYSCQLDTAYLHIPLSGSYSWSTGSTDSVLAVTENGAYSLTLTTNCFTIEDTIQLLRRQDPYFIDLGPPIMANLGQQLSFPFQHNLEIIESVSWRSLSGDSLSCRDCLSPNLTAIQPGEVELTVRDQRNCVYSDRVSYGVRQNKNIYLPNSFSPNGDGINDFFKPLGDQAIILGLHIFDRWGGLVFQHSGGTINDFEGWDGRNGRQLAEPGVYYYQLRTRFPDDDIKNYQGSILLVR